MSLQELKASMTKEVDQMQLSLLHKDGSVSAIYGRPTRSSCEIGTEGETFDHPTDEHLGIHEMWHTLKVEYRLDKVTLQHLPKKEGEFPCMKIDSKFTSAFQDQFRYQLDLTCYRCPFCNFLAWRDAPVNHKHDCIVRLVELNTNSKCLIDGIDTVWEKCKGR